MPWVIALMMGYQVFFLGLINFVVESPWIRLANPPSDGQGLMPLLQHPTMLVHPPALYTGYVAFGVPFAGSTTPTFPFVSRTYSSLPSGFVVAATRSAW